jgi:gluconate kinase
MTEEQDMNEVGTEPVVERPGAVPPEKSAAAIDSAEQRRRELTRELTSGAPLSDKEREQRLQELRGIVSKQSTAEEKDAAASATVKDNRERFGVKNIEFIAPQYKEAWNEDAENHFYQFAEQQAMEPSLVKSLVGDYAQQAQMNDGKVTDQMVEAFHKKYAHRLNQETRDKLVNWIRSGS